MEWLGDNKHSGAQLKGSQKYAFAFIAIGMTFVCASALVLFAKSTDMKDLYAAFSGILGGLIGGLITLEGVRRTVYAQTEIESLKLVPKKVLHLYKLKRDIVVLKKIKDNFSKWQRNMGSGQELNYDDESKEGEDLLIKLIPDYSMIREFIYKDLDDTEYNFVEISSEIDLTIYHKIRQLFKEFNDEIILLRETVQSFDLDLEFDYKSEIHNIIQLYNKCIIIKTVDGKIITEGREPFANTLRGSKTKTSEITNQLLRCLPHLQKIHNSLDKRILELDVMIDQKFKELDQKIL